MSGRQSAEVTRALQLIAKGMSAYAAAKQVGIALSTIYRATKRQRENRIEAIIDKYRKP
jgi:transposase